MRTDRLAPALQRLDPERRALLELSFRRGVADEDIAGLLGVEAGEVHRRCHEGVRLLSVELRLEEPAERERLAERLRALPAEAWRVPAGAGGGDAARPPGPAAEAPAATRPTRGRRRSGLFAALALVVVIAGVTVVVADDDEAGDERRTEGPASPPGAGAGGDDGAPGPAAQLRLVAGGRGRGTVRLVSDGSEARLLLRVRGLPAPRAGTYVIWLYNSVGDARPIGGSKRGSFQLDTRLGEGVDRYRYLDISLEPPEGNRAHSGASVLRVPLARLRPDR